VKVEDNVIAVSNDVDDLDEIFHNVDDEFTCKGQSQKFSLRMKDSDTLVFLGCKKEHNKLRVIINEG
jgi:hypothetical protein